MALVEVGAKYVLTNSALNSSLTLASTTSNASLVVEPLRSPPIDSQIWFVTATDDKERFRLHTVQKGPEWALDVTSYVTLQTFELHFFSKGAYNGQLWRFDKWGDNSDLRLSNNYTGPDIVLEVGTSRQVKLAGLRSENPAQRWTMSQLGSIATATTGSTTLATTLATITSMATTGAATTTTTPTTSVIPPNNSSTRQQKIAIGVGVSVGIVGLAVVIGLGVWAYKAHQDRKRNKNLRRI